MVSVSGEPDPGGQPALMPGKGKLCLVVLAVTFHFIYLVQIQEGDLVMLTQRTRGERLAVPALALVLVGIIALVALNFRNARGNAAETAVDFYQPFGSALKPILSCAGFMVVGPALMLLNKHIMEQRDFRYPLTLSGFGLVASLIFSRVAVALRLAQIRPETAAVTDGLKYWKVVVPIGVIRAIVLATGNAVYLHLSLGFIQMLKAFTPAIVLVVMCFARVQLPARVAIWCVILIIIGTLVDVNGELHATAMGLMLMITSIVGEAVSTVMSQKLLQNFKFTEIETMYFLSVPSFIALAGTASVLEWEDMWRRGRYALVWETPMSLIAAAALGIGVNFLTLMVIRATSAVTVKILNTLRCIGLVAVGAVFYGDVYTPVQLAGYAVSLVGFVGYNYFQVRGDQAEAVEAWIGQRLGVTMGSAKASPKDGMTMKEENSEPQMEAGESTAATRKASSATNQ